MNLILNRSLRNNASLCLMVLLLLLLPIFKGGNYPGVQSIFLLVMAVVFLLSVSDVDSKRGLLWFYVWFSVSVSVLVHVFVYPLFLDNERFFKSGLTLEIASRLNGLQLSKFRLFEVWSYFTAMWIFTFRVSLLTKRHVEILLTTLFIATTFQALYGVVIHISGTTSILGLWTKEHYLNDATGTFVNRNHFSGMLAIASPLVLSSLLSSKPLILPSVSQLNRLIISALYLMLIVFAFINSHSRMGMAAGLVGLFVCLLLLIKSFKVDASQKFSAWKLMVGVFLFLFLFVTWFGFADILERYVGLGEGNSRLDVWKAMLGMPFEVWFFGIGPGYFEDVFQTIKPVYFTVKFVYAHNDYLEFVYEFGLLLSIVIIAVCFYWYKGLKLAGGRFLLKPGVYGSIFAIGLHSLVDFNLQIPASALCFCLALGLLVNAELLDDMEGNGLVEKGGRKKVKPHNSKWRLPKNKREWLAFFRSN